MNWWWHGNSHVGREDDTFFLPLVFVMAIEEILSTHSLPVYTCGQLATRIDRRFPRPHRADLCNQSRALRTANSRVTPEHSAIGDDEILGRCPCLEINADCR